MFSGLPDDLGLPVPLAVAVLLCDPSVRLPGLQLLQLSAADEGLLRHAEHQLQARGGCGMTHGAAAVLQAVRPPTPQESLLFASQRGAAQRTPPARSLSVSYVEP